MSYRKLAQGKGKLENIIAVLRVLDKLDLLESFIPEQTFSPMEQLKLKAKQRLRATGSHKSNTETVHTENLDWYNTYKAPPQLLPCPAVQA